MRFISKISIALVAAALLHGAVFAASFTASLDRDSIMLGEQATLSLTFQGGSPNNMPVLDVPGLSFGRPNTSTSQNINFNTGQMSSTVSITYPVAAQRTGKFTIPALTADVGGQQLTTAPLTLTVTTASAPSTAAVNSGNEVAFLKFDFPKNKIYVGEPEVARLDLYLRDDVSGLNGFQLTSSPTDGFSCGKTAEQQGMRRRAQIGNRVYTVIPISMPLTAVRTGELTLGPFTASLVVVLPSQNGGGDPFFRMFNQGEQKQFALATDPVKVDSLPLPAQNQPANFTGAVGNFTMTATAGPTNVTVGDPITVRVQISGSGALDGVTLPPQDAWHDFKTYPPTSKLDTSDQFGFQGTKTFEQIVSPLNAEVHELPPLTFTFFNPNDGQYHTLTEPAVPLAVKAAGATPMPTLAAAQNPAPENQTPQDILPIKDKLGTLENKTVQLVAQPVFLAAQAVPVLAFLAAFIWRKRTDNLANNPRLRRQRAVTQLVRDGLNDLKKFAAANQPDEFFATLFRLLQEQLGERLDCPASAITENVVEENSMLRGAPEATLNGLRELFQLCNQARYAPVRGTSELNLVAAQFEKSIGELQNLKA
ncbi:MAG TPA: BatD family protein [Verrucomicrobiae bacterium]